MRVRVKSGEKGFIYGSLRNEGNEFTLKPVKGLKNGKAVTFTINQQFSDTWMEKLPDKAKEGSGQEAEKEGSE